MERQGEEAGGGSRGREQGRRGPMSRTQGLPDPLDQVLISAPPHWTQLVPLRTKEDTRRFLRCIYTKFLDIADENHNLFPLMDHLIQQAVLNDSDAQSLSGCHYPTSREKARRLWLILDTIDHGTFITKVLPPFCQHYWYIIPERCWLPGNASWVPETSGSWVEAEHPDCTRCSIEDRIRPVDVVDILVQAALITPKEHLDVIQGYRMRSTNWLKIFDAFKKLAGCDVSSHVARMQKLIDEHSLPVPDNLPELLTTGFPCTCHSHRPQSEYCLSTAASGTATSSDESSLPLLRFSWPSLQTRTDSLSPSPSAPSHSLSSDIHRQNDDEETALKEVVSVSSDIHRQNDEETALKEVVSVGTMTRLSTTEDDSSDGESGRGATQVSGEHIALEQVEPLLEVVAQGESGSPAEVEEKIAESCFEESVYYETDQTSLSELTVTKTAWRKSSLMKPTQEIKQRACTGSLKEEQRDCTEGNSGHYTPHTKSEVPELHDPSLLEPFVPKGNTRPETSDPVGDATESPRRDACAVIFSPAEQQNERQKTRSVDDHPAQSDNDSDASVTNVKTRVFAWGGNKSCATFCLKFRLVFDLFCLVVDFLPFVLHLLSEELSIKWLRWILVGVSLIYIFLSGWWYHKFMCSQWYDFYRCVPHTTCPRGAGLGLFFCYRTFMPWLIALSPFALLFFGMYFKIKPVELVGHFLIVTSIQFPLYQEARKRRKK